METESAEENLEFKFLADTSLTDSTDEDYISAESNNESSDGDSENENEKIKKGLRIY